MANDVIIILTIMVIFIGLGTILPFVQSELGEAQVTVDTQGILTEVGDEVGDPSGGVGILSILFSIIKMFFWTFGDVPVIIDALFFTPVRLAFVFLIARNIWPGGGA